VEEDPDMKSDCMRTVAWRDDGGVVAGAVYAEASWTEAAASMV
jgi:hypothetical protein